MFFSREWIDGYGLSIRPSLYFERRYSGNVVRCVPMRGCGKSTMAHQFAFANATRQPSGDRRRGFIPHRGTAWQATTFLIGEYDEAEIRDNPVFTVADGLVWLSQVAERNSIVRKLQVIKLRGQPRGAASK